MSRRTIGADLAAERLDERIADATRLLGIPGADSSDPDVEPVELLDRALHAGVDHRRVWLLLTAVSTVFPADPLVREVRRELELVNPGVRAEILLRVGLDLMRDRGNPAARLVIVQDEWVVDVSHSAKHESNTGIQRVVRNAVSCWARAERPIVLACWADHDAGYRTLDRREEARVLAWDDRARWPAAATEPDTLIVPWQTTVVLPEVPSAWQCDVLASLARHSGNRVVAVGHDCIPVVTADMLPQRESNKFVHYLALIKLIDRIAAVSRSAAAEFTGFTVCLPTQGLTGPQVVACPLPVEVPTAAAADATPKATPPMITCVGSHEPRKNHMAVLFAAETLWRQGLQFSIRFIGGKSWDDQGFEEWADSLRRHGRAVSLEHGVADPELWRAYRQSRFTMFPSLHEGYGLPVAESIAMGTPVITSDHGSTAEIAADGGALLVNPRSDADLVEAMRALLTDDDLCERLSAAARARRRPTWAQYAGQLWAAFDQTGSDTQADTAPDTQADTAPDTETASNTEATSDTEGERR